MIIERQWREIINAELARLPLSRSAFARMLGVSPQVVTNYLNGHDAPSPEMMERFLRVLKLQPKLMVEELCETATADA